MFSETRLICSGLQSIGGEDVDSILEPGPDSGIAAEVVAVIGLLGVASTNQMMKTTCWIYGISKSPELC